MRSGANSNTLMLVNTAASGQGIGTVYDYDREALKILGILAPGDFLSISYPRHVARQFADRAETAARAFTIGFTSPVPQLSMGDLRDLLFSNSGRSFGASIIDMSCLKRGSSRGAIDALDREKELQTIALGLKTIIVAVHDEDAVDPYVAMTQPFVFDNHTEEFTWNHFAVPVKQLLKRLECSGDREWFQTFGHTGF